MGQQHRGAGPLRDNRSRRWAMRKLWYSSQIHNPASARLFRYHRQTSRSGKPVSCLEIPKDDDSYPSADRSLQASRGTASLSESDCPNSANAMIDRHIPKILEKSSLAIRHATCKSIPATSSQEVKQNFHRPNIFSLYGRAPLQHFIAPTRFSAHLSQSGVAPHGLKKKYQHTSYKCYKYMIGFVLNYTHNCKTFYLPRDAKMIR